MSLPMVEIMLLLFQKYEDNVRGNLGHIIVTLGEHGEMTHEKHSLSFAVKFHATPKSAPCGLRAEHWRAAHCT